MSLTDSTGQTQRPRDSELLVLQLSHRFYVIQSWRSFYCYPLGSKINCTLHKSSQISLNKRFCVCANITLHAHTFNLILLFEKNVGSYSSWWWMTVHLKRMKLIKIYKKMLPPKTHSDIVTAEVYSGRILSPIINWIKIYLYDNCVFSYIHKYRKICYISYVMYTERWSNGARPLRGRGGGVIHN